MTTLTWEQIDAGVYCCDGDGIVEVRVTDSGFEVHEQYECVATLETIGDAFAYAEQLLLNDYPAVYAANNLEG